MAIIEFFSPPTCGVCDRELSDSVKGLCEECDSVLEHSRLTSDGRCPVCYHSLNSKGKCLYCQGRNVFFDSHISFYRLTESWHGYLKRWKFQNDRRLAFFLAEKINKLRNLYSNINEAVVIDSGRGVYKVRAYQPCIDLARWAGFNVIPAIRKKKSVRKQSQRGLTDRFFEIHNALEFRKNIKNFASFENKEVILIEDLFTTGATANEASRVLKEYGAKKVYLLTMFFHEGSYDTDGKTSEERDSSGQSE